MNTAKYGYLNSSINLLSHSNVCLCLWVDKISVFKLRKKLATHPSRWLLTWRHEYFSQWWYNVAIKLNSANKLKIIYLASVLQNEVIFYVLNL